MSPAEVALAIIAVALSFVVSASAGLGGSLVLVPALALILGTKEGAALAALLLAGNNVVKLIAYRASIPWRSSAWIVLATIVGAAIGARLLVEASEDLVTVAVILSLIGSLVVERFGLITVQRQSAPVLAVGSGLTSGFSGTSGPLKGVAVRALRLDRLRTVGAASLVSFAGDATKTAIYADAALIGPEGVVVAVVAAPLMVVATLFGRSINRSIGEKGYMYLFWGVTTAYTWRLISGL